MKETEHVAKSLVVVSTPAFFGKQDTKDRNARPSSLNSRVKRPKSPTKGKKSC